MYPGNWLGWIWGHPGCVSAVVQFGCVYSADLYQHCERSAGETYQLLLLPTQWWRLPTSSQTSTSWWQSGRWQQILSQFSSDFLAMLLKMSFSFSALTLLVGRQEGHAACKNSVVGCWRGYLSGARCRLDTTATHCLLLQWNPDWFCPSGTSSLTRVVLDKGPLNVHVCVRACVI